MLLLIGGHKVLILHVDENKIDCKVETLVLKCSLCLVYAELLSVASGDFQGRPLQINIYYIKQ